MNVSKSIFYIEQWPLWFPLGLFLLGILLMVFIKIKIRGRKQMTEKEATVFYRGYLLSLIGSSFGVVMGISYCMPYFS